MGKKAEKEYQVIVRNADGTICEDISKKKWSKERSELIWGAFERGWEGQQRRKKEMAVQQEVKL